MNYLHVKAVEVEEEVATVYLEQELDERLGKEMKDGERILVDSDEFAFIYIIEDEEGFYGIRFDEQVWPQLKEGFNKGTTYFLKLNEMTRLTLAEFNEEMTFLLENIRGNGNYGEAFEQTVKAMFE
ncbi:hypothetical protein MM326_12870 [Alkalihalobacillus sp. LMS6]|uniref:UPF0738 family protein n=1 Tax=Bacillaceae TaxID=186817 RepID=UPI000C069EE0|nr:MULTISPECIES: hypothetical protein [Bacillaceae]UTR05001.1 hypothetical protein MM326_12870 [Alkalihalobacillus sp. LMS6]